MKNYNVLRCGGLSYCPLLLALACGAAPGPEAEAEGSGGGLPGGGSPSSLPAGGSTGSGGATGGQGGRVAGADGTGGTAGGGVADAADTCGTVSEDVFGVKKIFPTKLGGREWCLPADATQPDGKGWDGAVQATNEPGVFRVSGSPRLFVSSPAGKAWWHNVELTAYYRLISTLSGRIAPGWQLYARGERHTTNNVDAASINRGIPAPAGTPVWPGYPFSGTVNGHCLGSSYKGYLEINGNMRFKKEMTHTGGYTGARGTERVFSGGVPRGSWVGFKTMIRNYNDDGAVHMESWLDAQGDGNWRKMVDVNDTGGWSSSNLDGCNTAPFNFRNDQLVTWAGPYVNYRFDNISADIKWWSAREIEPLP